MNANELTFGIEIETVAPTNAFDDHQLRIGSRHRGIQVPYLPLGWKAEDDSSIDTRGCGRACEIVSPVLRGAEGLAEVIEVLKTLQTIGHRVNDSCGVHVHIGWKRDWSSIALARLITIVAYCERGLYAITGTKNRERGHYCRGVRQFGDDKQAKNRLDQERYHTLNLTNLALGTKDTVEFRVFSGSLKAKKVLGWIQVCLGLVERALTSKRQPTWNPKPPSGGWKKAGEGQSEAERLMGYLAWGNGYARAHGGRQFGWIAAEGLKQEEVRTEFRRLAKQYDAQA